jgi:DNA-binding response OmpR family regulator
MPGDSSIQLMDRRSHQPGTRKVRLLIIEDTDVHAAIIARSAAKLGFVETKAQSYEKACNIEQFDCITLDLGLGDHVGFDIFRLFSQYPVSSADYRDQRNI